MGCVCEVLSASFRPPRNSIIQLQVEERTLQRLPELRGSLGEFRRGKILSSAALKDARENSDGIRRQASSAFCSSRFRDGTPHMESYAAHSSSFYNYRFLFAVFQDQPDGGKYADGASRRGTCPGSNPPDHASPGRTRISDSDHTVRFRNAFTHARMTHRTREVQLTSRHSSTSCMESRKYTRPSKPTRGCAM